MTTAQQYADAVDRVATLAEHLTPQQEARTVPATPQWRVRDLLAHLAGTARDVVEDRTDDAPSPAWTNRQILARRTVGTADLAAELREQGGLLPSALFEAPGPTPAWDLLVHEADLREALNLPRTPETAWRTMLPGLVATIGSRPGALGFEVTTAEHTWQIGTPTTTIAFAGDDYELWRVLFSRRSTERIARLTTGIDLLENVSVFGPRTT